ncbi:MAG: metal ABC transporter substrate-binding protein [Lachnospiraceae bacterium]|nr:metal ABC transporter substrate-binding protein [Lachnospiraceae bacterium]
MKKFLTFIITLAFMLNAFTGCAVPESNINANGSKGADEKISIVTTIFPEYDWVKSVLGDKADDAEVTMLLDKGVDLHSYQPTTDDILKISTCDLFIYVGGESDGWVDDALTEATNKDMIVINLLDTLEGSVKEEEMIEGMQEGEHAHEHEHEDGEEAEDADYEHEHEDGEEAEDADHEHDEEAEDADHEHEHEDGEEAEDADHEHEHEDGEEAEDADHEHEHEHEEGEVEYDEHVWLSLRNASTIVSSISDALAKISPDNADTYKKNADAYITELNNLDSEYKTAISSAKSKTILFGDRFPFRYLVDDYDLDYYAAFVGCSAETEASFETITFLANKVDELSLTSVMTIEKSDQKIAKTIVENTTAKNQKILTLDSMQATTSDDVKNGATYMSIMQSNLSVLKEALN